MLRPFCYCALVAAKAFVLPAARVLQRLQDGSAMWPASTGADVILAFTLPVSKASPSTVISGPPAMLRAMLPAVYLVTTAEDTFHTPNRRTRACADPVAVVATDENNSTKAAAAADATVTSRLPRRTTRLISYRLLAANPRTTKIIANPRGP
ncbi:hypothetical protein VTJ04DRAFT_9695 [Mycothermus thermophilus]|uniref:uncharacterized protein n=1 Tax=Humicola insolens TaxID=85995 RepID=UPI00374370F0